MKSTHTTPTAGTLGTFAGVFTPSILTILGIVLFLRLGYIVGSAGLAQCLVMLALANGISVLTSLSLSAIATNLKVKQGGDYYLISRTLGYEFGGAIGIVLFLAQSVSIAFYCIGFGEAAAGVLETGTADAQVIAAVAVCILFVLAWLGTDWATRFQYLVMGLLGISLAAFFAGGFLKWDFAQLVGNWPAPPGGPEFWVLFALLFPAVTGFTQGVSMSGELRDPGRSLPRGTFLAIGLSILIYFLSAVVFAAALPRDLLLHDYAAMNRIAILDWLIVGGVAAATFIRQEGVDAFPLVVVAPSLDTGIYGLVQGFGIGPLRANTILLNWVEHLPKDGSRLVELSFGRHLRTAFRLGCNLVVLDGTDPEWEALEKIPPEQRRIDVWWCGDASSRLMLLLAYLMTRTEAWEGARIRLFGACRAADTKATVEALDEMLDEVRIDAEPHVVTDAGPADIADHSGDASLVFVPFRLHGNRPVGPFGGDLDALLAPLPLVALVLAAKDIDLDAEPEQSDTAPMDDVRMEP